MTNYPSTRLNLNKIPSAKPGAVHIAIKNKTISLEQGRIFNDIYVHLDTPLNIPRTTYIMFSPSVQNQVIARCAIIFTRLQDGIPTFQIDIAVLPQYRKQNWGTTLVTKALIEFENGMKNALPTGFFIEAVVDDEDNEASKKIARSLIGGEEILFNKDTQSNVHSFLKKFAH